MPAGKCLVGLKRNLVRTSAVELRKLRLERYKGYAESAEVELAPLTILEDEQLRQDGLATAVSWAAACLFRQGPRNVPLESVTSTWGGVRGPGTGVRSRSAVISAP